MCPEKWKGSFSQTAVRYKIILGMGGELGGSGAWQDGSLPSWGLTPSEGSCTCDLKPLPLGLLLEGHVLASLLLFLLFSDVVKNTSGLK